MAENDFDFSWLNNSIHIGEDNIPDMPDEFAERMHLEDDAHKADIESLEVLKEIKMNTDYLRSIVELLDTNNEYQKEQNEMVKGILNIAKAPDKEEARSRYNTVMKKIGDYAAASLLTLNVVKLSSLAATVLKLFSQIH